MFQHKSERIFGVDGQQSEIEVRDKTLRMLEGYLIAFGPAIIVEDEE